MCEGVTNEGKGFDRSGHGGGTTNKRREGFNRSGDGLGGRGAASPRASHGGGDKDVGVERGDEGVTNLGSNDKAILFDAGDVGDQLNGGRDGAREEMRGRTWRPRQLWRMSMCLAGDGSTQRSSRWKEGGHVGKGSAQRSLRPREGDAWEREAHVKALDGGG